MPQFEDISELDDVPLTFEVDGTTFEFLDGWPRADLEKASLRRTL